MSRLNPLDLNEAIKSVAEALSNVESFKDDIVSDLENLIDNMRRYDGGDGVDTLLDGINDFISECESIIGKCQ